MKTALQPRRQLARRLHGSSGRLRATLLPVPSAAPSSQGHTDIQAFREQALLPQKPLLFRNDAASPTSHLRSLNKWFSKDPGGFSAYMDSFQDWPFPYELILSSSEMKHALASFRDWLLESSDITDQILAGILKESLAEGEDRTFFQLVAPLRLLVKALEFNRAQRSKATSTLELYIAQSELGELPRPLQDDLLPPKLVKHAGKGDIYQSSLWVGTEPTYTPLHRDPNPNLFCQLCGCKVVRLLPPSSGDRLFYEVQAKIHQRGNSRIRSTEMMEGQERKVLHDAVWNDGEAGEFHQAELSPGDALFIPDGWWHSVKSNKAEGQLNGSVNWWFR